MLMKRIFVEKSRKRCYLKSNIRTFRMIDKLEGVNILIFGFETVKTFNFKGN